MHLFTGLVASKVVHMVQDGVGTGEVEERAKVDGRRGVTRHSSPCLGCDGDLKRTGLWWFCSQFGEVTIQNTVLCILMVLSVVAEHGVVAVCLILWL